MSSVKKLKSRGRAASESIDYAYRKRAFADLPAAKLVKPLKALRRQAAESFDHLRLALRIAGGDESAAPVQEARAGLNFDRVLVGVATKLAARGQGVAVHNFAVTHLR